MPFMKSYNALSFKTIIILNLALSSGAFCMGSPYAYHKLPDTNTDDVDYNDEPFNASTPLRMQKFFSMAKNWINSGNHKNKEDNNLVFKGLLEIVEWLSQHPKASVSKSKMVEAPKLIQEYFINVESFEYFKEIANKKSIISKFNNVIKDFNKAYKVFEKLDKSAFGSEKSYNTLSSEIGMLHDLVDRLTDIKEVIDSNQKNPGFLLTGIHYRYNITSKMSTFMSTESPLPYSQNLYLTFGEDNIKQLTDLKGKIFHFMRARSFKDPQEKSLFSKLTTFRNKIDRENEGSPYLQAINFFKGKIKAGGHNFLSERVISQLEDFTRNFETRLEEYLYATSLKRDRAFFDLLNINYNLERTLNENDPHAYSRGLRDFVPHVRSHELSDTASDDESFELSGAESGSFSDDESRYIAKGKKVDYQTF